MIGFGLLQVAGAVSQAEEFRQRDPSGGVMTIIAITIVFAALVCVFLIVKGYGALMQRLEGRGDMVDKMVDRIPVAGESEILQQLDEQIAAIGLALRLYQEEQHVNESRVLTLNRVSRMYSPWSSKIHGITQLPEHK